MHKSCLHSVPATKASGGRAHCGLTNVAPTLNGQIVRLYGALFCPVGEGVGDVVHIMYFSSAKRRRLTVGLDVVGLLSLGSSQRQLWNTAIDIFC